jgi:hypothetical protein
MDEEKRTHGSKLRVVAWCVTLMFASFAGGVFVGQHPKWVPIPSWLPGGTSTPDDAGSDLLRHHEIPTPANTPTTQPDTQMPQTQPAGQ